MVVDGDANAVSVRVGGKHQVAVDVLAQLDTQLQGGFFLRVRVWTGREVAVRSLLLAHDLDVLDADSSQDAADQLVAGAVEWGVDHLQVTWLYRCLADTQCKDAVEILVDQLVGDILNHAAAQTLLQRNLFDPIKDVGLAGKLQHLGSSLRVQLAAVVAVCLVAVVLGWVVAGSDDDAGAAMQLTNGKGQGRGRHQFFEEISLDPVCSKDTGGHTGKQVALDAAVISDGNRWVFIFFVDIIRHALGSQSDGVDVHAVGAYAKDAAQTGCAEFQHFYKAFFNLIVVSFDVDHFCNQVRVLQLL